MVDQRTIDDMYMSDGALDFNFDAAKIAT